LVEINTETDFAAKNEDFRTFVKDIVPAERVEKEKEILRAQALNEGKPEKIVEKMVEGRLEKFYKEICLLEQPFIKDPDKTVQQLLNEKIAIIGENINIRRFVMKEAKAYRRRKKTLPRKL